MRRIGFLALAVVAFGATAYAGNDDDGFKFRCRFLTDLKGNPVCLARGIIKEKDGPGITNHEERGSRLEVTCEGAEVFEGRAKASFRDDKIKIEGESLGDKDEVTIIMKKPDRRDDDDRVSAIIRLAGGDGRGSCEIKKLEDEHPRPAE